MRLASVDPVDLDVAAIPNSCGSWPASDDGLTINLDAAAVPNCCGSWPASDDALTADRDAAAVPNSCGSWPCSDDALTINRDAAAVPNSCGSGPASDDALTAVLDVAAVPDFCGSWLASDGGLTADLNDADRVHIHCCGNGCLGFRSYSGSLWKSPKVTKGLLPLSFGASPRLGLSRGQEDQKPKPNRGGLPAGLFVRLYTPPCRSWLAGDDVIPANPAAPYTPPSPASRAPTEIEYI